MKRMLSLSLALILMLCACAGGANTGSGTASNKTPEELTAAYTQAITGARSEEENTIYPVMTDANDDLAPLILPMLGVTGEDMSAFGIAVSPMNVRAYGVAAIKPVEGKETVVKEGLENFVATQKQNFFQYLEDQYAIAEAAKVEVLGDGTVLLVMCENADNVLKDIKTALNG